MRNEQWIFYENFSVFGQIENVWMNKISSKTFTSISQLPSVRIHGSLSMQECRDESEIYIYQWIQLSNNKFINVISGAGGGGYAWPGLTAIIITLSNVVGFVFTRRVSSSAKLIVRSACAEFISSKDSTVETVLGTHRATSLADNYSKSKSPPNQSNNMDQSDWRSSQLRLLKK